MTKILIILALAAIVVTGCTLLDLTNNNNNSNDNENNNDPKASPTPAVTIVFSAAPTLPGAAQKGATILVQTGPPGPFLLAVDSSLRPEQVNSGAFIELEPGGHQLRLLTLDGANQSDIVQVIVPE